MTNDYLIVVIMTYKNKLLLLSPDIKLPKNSEIAFWGLICDKKSQYETDYELAVRKVKYATKLTLNTFKTVYSHNNNNILIYHVNLTDDDVNTIERRDGQRIEFFEKHELSKISLNPQTQSVFAQHTQLIQELLT